MKKYSRVVVIVGLLAVLSSMILIAYAFYRLLGLETGF